MFVSYHIFHSYITFTSCISILFHFHLNSIFFDNLTRSIQPPASQVIFDIIFHSRISFVHFFSWISLNDHLQHPQINLHLIWQFIIVSRLSSKAENKGKKIEFRTLFAAAMYIGTQNDSFFTLSNVCFVLYSVLNATSVNYWNVFFPFGMSSIQSMISVLASIFIISTKPVNIESEKIASFLSFFFTKRAFPFIHSTKY